MRQSFICTVVLFAVFVFSFVTAQEGLAPVRYSQKIVGDKPRMIFEKISHPGLSLAGVFSIMQDKQGHIWFGTEQGLHRYDGYDVKIYPHVAYDSTSLSDHWVWDMIEDQHGNIWVGTNEGGLNRMDHTTGKFTHFKHDRHNSATISNNTVRWLLADGKGDIWASTLHGLNRLDRHTGEFMRYYQDPLDSSSLSHNTTNMLFEDRSGTIWVSTRHGLNRYNRQSDNFTRFLYGNESLFSSNPRIYDIYEDPQKPGVLWLGSAHGLIRLNTENKNSQRFMPLGEDFSQHVLPSQHLLQIAHNPKAPNILWLTVPNFGVAKFDIDNQTFSLYEPDPRDPTSLSSALPWSILCDRTGLVWVSTRDATGLSKFDPQNAGLTHFRGDRESKIGLAGRSVWGIYEDRSGALWVGTEGDDGNHLNRIDRSTGDIEHWQHDPNDPTTLGGSGRIFAVYEDYAGEIWVGGDYVGLNRLNRSTGKFVRFQHDPDDTTSLSHSWVSIIREGRDSTLWIGTMRGLNLFDRDTGGFRVYEYDPDDSSSLSHNEVIAIYEDISGKLWVGTRDGLNLFDREQEQFRRFKVDLKNDNSLSGNYITCLHERAREPGVLWIGFIGGGLCRLDSRSETVTRFTSIGDHSPTIISGILEDKQGQLWISSSQGLFCFDPETGTSKEYGLESGLQSIEFNGWAYFQSRSGEMFFGGVNGLNAFFPEQLVDNPQPPAIAIQDVKLFNESLQPGPDSPLRTSLAQANEIQLEHWQKDLTFDYVGLHFKNPGKNTYRYQLTPYENEWVDAGTRRSAAYTNLEPGNYTFQVTAANSDGVWNEDGKSLKISIASPWWKTWWAYLLYLLMAGGMIFAYIRYKTAAQAKELAREREASERLRRIDKLKDEFLANTSHELRTPLNGIIGITESVLDGTTGKISARAKSNLALVVSSGKRLASLVNDILDFSKLKTRDLELQKKAVDLLVLTDLVLRFSESLLAGKQLQLKNEIPADLPAVEADENRLQQILHNLIGNAIKFTEKGQVIISATEGTKDENDTKMIVVSVSDRGIGIPPEKHEAIFQSFEQVDASTAREYGGTGLGLSITKQLVELHGGKIWLASEVGKGTTVSFTLPISNQEALPLESTTPALAKIQDLQPAFEPEVEMPASITNGHISILVVDDEPVNQQVLANHLGSVDYRIEQAFNGEQALKAIANGHTFDLVLLDIMMPRMSGYEVCQKIRETYLPSELPVIMVTAKNQITDLLEGFSSGANDYLAKPFSKSELLARIKTHLNLHHINTAYGRFVPQEFLRSLGRESIIDVKLGDHVHDEMTILFSDIRGYSTLSEQMTPEENFKFLNGYLKRIGPVITKHNGFVNQYYGDGIMALYLGEASDAVNAAVEMHRALAEYNEHRRQKGRQAIEIGVGLHTGPLMIGIIGDKKRLNASVVSDAVNTASRMEGLTKFYGAPIIISEDTLSRMNDITAYNPRYLGKAQVKGKKQPVKVYEVIAGNKSETVALKTATQENFEQGLSYYHAKQFTRASVYFKKVLKTNPLDKTAQLYLERSAQFMVEGVPDNWEGVEMMDSK